MRAAHTPTAEALHLPLSVERRHDTTIIRDRFENLVAASSDAGEADAIVAMCNSHDALVAALESVANGLRQALAFKDREMLDAAVRLSADECDRAALAPTKPA